MIIVVINSVLEIDQASKHCQYETKMRVRIPLDRIFGAIKFNIKDKFKLSRLLSNAKYIAS